MKNITGNLPHKSDELFITDGGLETTMIFLEGFDLPYFASFDMMKERNSYNALKDYYRKYLKIAAQYQCNFILESPTWRANPDWIKTVGYALEDIENLNNSAIQMLKDLKVEFQSRIRTILISGCIGPRGDGYVADLAMSAEKAAKYHGKQIEILAKAGVDLISAITMTNVAEAIGIVKAAQFCKLPVVISFTVETDGTLPSGATLKEAIQQVDLATTEGPIYYMINCAHPQHFIDTLNSEKNSQWVPRIKGIRANASCKSHAELDESTELDRGNPELLSYEYKALKKNFQHMNVFGGCCGTDDEHMQHITKQLTEALG